MSEREDRDLQKYLDGNSRVSRHYKALEKAEPGPALDAAILAAAHEEAARPVRPAWMVPAALAATVVLGVGLSLQLQNEPSAVRIEAPAGQAVSPIADADNEGTRDARAEMDSADSAVVAEAKREARQSSEQAAEPAEDAYQADGVGQSLDRSDDAGRERRVQTESFAAPAASTSDPAHDRSAAEAPATFAPAPPPAAALSPPSPPPSSPVASPAPAPVIVPAPTGDEATRAAAPTDADVLFQAQAGRQSARTAAPAPKDAKGQLAASAPEHDGALEEREEMTANARPGASSEITVSGYRQNSLDGLTSRTLPGAASEASPALQLRYIEALWERGDKEEAQRLFDAFRKRFPDYVIPESFPLEDTVEEDAKTPASPPSE